MESIPNWELLPAKNLQSIFMYLNFFDVERCLQVCHRWYSESNFYLKDKFWLKISKVKKLKDFKATKRRFQFLRIDQEKENDKLLHTILSFLTQLKLTDPILETYIQFDDYLKLSRILKLIHGNHVKTLTLHWMQTKLFNSIFLELLDYGCLISVEHLTIEQLDDTFLNISTSFGKLKSLKLETFHASNLFVEFEDIEVPISVVLLQNFINLNPLTTLNLENAMISVLSEDRQFSLDVQSLLSFRNVNNLKRLHLNSINSEQDIQCITKHYNHLDLVRVLHFRETLFRPNYVNEMFRIPNLSFDYIQFKTSTDFNRNTLFWEDTWSNTTNLKVTHLHISLDIWLKEKCLQVFSKSFPNMKSFECLNVCESVSVSLFSEMAKSWTKLESLYIGFEDKLLPSRSNEIINFQKLRTCCFENLFIEREETLQLFSLFKTVNLRTMILDCEFGFGKASFIDKIFEHLSENCPNIAKFELKGLIENPVTNSLLNNFPNLGELNTVFLDDPEDHPEAADMITDMLEIIMKKREKNMNKIAIRTNFRLENFDFESFCKEHGAITDYKDHKLRRILIKNIEIIFCREDFSIE